MISTMERMVGRIQSFAAEIHLTQTQEYTSGHRIGADEVLMAGFKDGGRRTKFDILGKAINAPSREVIVFKNPSEDQVIKNIIGEARVRVAEETTLLGKIQCLNQIVQERLPFTGVDESDAKIKLVYKANSDNQEISLGQLISACTGVCRHRSLLFKVLADEVGVKAALVRGNYGVKGDIEGHAWNEVIDEKGNAILVDTMHGFIGSFGHPKIDKYQDVNFEPMYTRHSERPLDLSNLTIERISKGNQNGLDIDVSNMTVSEQYKLLESLGKSGVKGSLNTSSAFYGSLVIRCMGDQNANVMAGLKGFQMADHPASGIGQTDSSYAPGRNPRRPGR